MTFENEEKNSDFRGTAVIQPFINMLVIVTEHSPIYRFEDHMISATIFFCAICSYEIKYFFLSFFYKYSPIFTNIDRRIFIMRHSWN